MDLSFTEFKTRLQSTSETTEFAAWWFSMEGSKKPNEGVTTINGDCGFCGETLDLYILYSGTTRHEHPYGFFCPSCTATMIIGKYEDMDDNTKKCWGCDLQLEGADLVGMVPTSVTNVYQRKYKPSPPWKNLWNSKQNLVFARNESQGCYQLCPYCLDEMPISASEFACGYRKHKCNPSYVSEDMKRIFPIEDTGFSQFCMYCSRPTKGNFHYKNTIDANVGNTLAVRTIQNTFTPENSSATNFLYRPGCGGKREMIARILAIQNKITEQMLAIPDTINTKEANNQRALYSQLHFPTYLEQADQIILANPGINEYCGKADACNIRGKVSKFLADAGIDPTLGEFDGQGGYRKKRKQTKKRRQTMKKKLRKQTRRRR